MSESDTPVEAAPCPTESTVGGTTTVTVRGEIDLLTAPRLMARLDRLTAVPHPDLVLDLRRMSFIDCAGLADVFEVLPCLPGPHPVIGS